MLPQEEMAFTSWHILSPMQWARWMWTAVRSSGDYSLLAMQRIAGNRQVSPVIQETVTPLNLFYQGPEGKTAI